LVISVVAFSERLEAAEWVLVEREVMDFHSSIYSAFLAGVRNYSLVQPIAEPRGVPYDISKAVAEEFADWGEYAVVPSWLSIQELLTFDYDQKFEDRRVARRAKQGYMDHAVTGEPGEGKIVSYREFLMDGFFTELQRLSKSGAQRVIFWFSI
jgi:hypothetical protein